MPLDCPQCHTPNAEHARKCMACGAALPLGTTAFAPDAAPRLDQDSDTFDALYAPTLMMGAGHGTTDDHHADDLPLPRQRTMPKPARRAPALALWGTVAVILGAGAWWFFGPTSPGIVPSAAPASAVPVPLPAASTPPSATPPAATLPASGAEPASAASPPAPVQSAASGPASAPKTAVARPRKLTSPAATTSTPTQAASEPGSTAAEAPAASTPVLLAEPITAPVPEARATAQQICASRNFFLRSYCEASECGKPEHADETHCKSLQQAAPRRPGH